MAKTEIKNILISQPAPVDIEKSQYKGLIDKYKVNLTFYKFFNIVGVSNKEFRTLRISLLNYSAVILTSKLAVDNYFRMAKELRVRIPETMKYFCVTESIANYLQNYIQYRKRKIFFGKLTFQELLDVISKHKEENYLFPCAEDATQDNFAALEKAKVKFTKSVMYRSEAKDLSNIDISKFDMVVVFSPIGVKSFVQSFPKIKDDEMTFAAFGTTTQAALKSAKIKVLIPAPSSKYPSMVMAIDKYLSVKPEDMSNYIAELEADAAAVVAKKKEVAAKAAAKAKIEALRLRTTQKDNAKNA